MQKYLVVGLGNPGTEYENTRHNIGWRILQLYAKRKNWKFSKERKVKSLIAKGEKEEKQMIIALPLTFMNLSGVAVKKCMEHYGIEKSNFLVIVDDADLPFGKLRFRHKGSSGGHRGLESIEDALQTREYHRIKVGIGRNPYGELIDYVLEPFTEKEEEQLPKLMDQSIDILEKWWQTPLDAPNLS